jgi:ubiquinone/menaquinone biosynthesis C-methylase UbiE
MEGSRSGKVTPKTKQWRGRLRAWALAPSMDAVVSMFALCTVADPARTLDEVLRVLKPGGMFVFMEHVAAPAGTVLRLMQRTSRSYWVRFADECLPDADTLPLIQAAGFSRVNYEAFSVAVPLISHHVAGMAIR